MADRLLFSKTGRAKYISHLDLMRTFQRAFFRSGHQVRHTEGFNPHHSSPSRCLCQWATPASARSWSSGWWGAHPMRRCPARLTAAMPEGIVIHSCYPAQRR